MMTACAAAYWAICGIILIILSQLMVIEVLAMNQVCDKS